MLETFSAETDIGGILMRNTLFRQSAQEPLNILKLLALMWFQTSKFYAVDTFSEQTAIGGNFGADLGAQRIAQEPCV